jgi:thiol-disulfide isomerase/thioredoxin
LTYDFIYTPKENLLIDFDPESFYSSLVIIEGYNNKLLLELKKEIFKINESLNLLSSAANQNPELNGFIQEKYIEVIDERNQLIKSYQNKFTDITFNKLAGLFIENSKSKTMKEYFQEVDWTDSTIIRSNVLPGKIINYFGLNTDLTESSFKNGIDSLMLWTIGNKQNHNFFLYYLLNLFGKVGPEEIFKYILSNHYFIESCDAEISNPDIAKKISNFTALLPGNKIPEFSGKSKNNKVISIHDFIEDNKNIYILFWSPHCSFCEKIIPDLYKLVSNQKKIKLYSFAVTDEEDSWLKKQQRNRKNWIEVTDLEGWKGNVAEILMISKTPLLIEVDENGIILQYDINPAILMNNKK